MVDGMTSTIKSDIPVPHRAKRYAALYVLEPGQCTDIEVTGSLGLGSLRASINYIQHKHGRKLTTRTIRKDPGDPAVRTIRVWRVE
jgi:hypothetical protein